MKVSAEPFSSSSRISAGRQAVLRSKTARAVRPSWRSDLIVPVEREATAATKENRRVNFRQRGGLPDSDAMSGTRGWTSINSSPSRGQPVRFAACRASVHPSDIFRSRYSHPHGSCSPEADPYTSARPLNSYRPLRLLKHVFLYLDLNHRKVISALLECSNYVLTDRIFNIDNRRQDV